MIRYEVLMLTVPEITSDEVSRLESQFEELLREKSATLISFERWGKYRLAYPVRDNDYGIYFLIRFEVAPDAMQQALAAIRTMFAVKNNELVMRFLTSHLDTKTPLAYHRPESLEEVPTRDVDTFLKESKMTGLLDKSHREARVEVPEVEQESKVEIE